jgi:5-methylcytosine-specific restriction enzyme subunit McrC
VIDDWEIRIVDTKWKLLDANNETKNYEISQSDMYQLFAYAKKYKSKKLYLIYPKTENFTKALAPFHYEKEDVILHVIPYDLEDDSCEII